MIRLTDAVYVAADQVSELRIPDHRNGVTVILKSGESHWVPSDYGQSAYATADRLAALVDAQLGAATGGA